MLLIPFFIILLVCFLVLISISIGVILIKKKKEIKIKSRNYEILRRESLIQKKLNNIDFANSESQKEDKALMEKRKLKAVNNSEFDLFFDEEKKLHKQRLELYKKSKWKGQIYYKTEEGLIYIVSRNGKKIYIK